jgi:chorismate-pyruvate lyase
MDLEDIEKRKSALGTILAQMDVPEMRKELDNTGNLRWLNRNLAIRNKNHPMFNTARTLLTDILKWGKKWL